MPTFTPNSVILYVSDVEVSTRFYRCVLAAEPLETFEGFAVFALSDTFTLGLQAADQIDPRPEPHIGGSELSLSDVDRGTVDRLYAAWIDAGVRIALEPTELEGRDEKEHRRPALRNAGGWCGQWDCPRLGG